MKVLMVDIDQVLASSTQRHKLGLEYVARELGRNPLQIISVMSKEEKKLFYSDKGYFNPEYIQFDTFSPDAPDLWRMMEFVNQTVILTPRPHWLQYTTEKWLRENALWNKDKMTVVCKDYSTKVKYLTNIEWVAIMMREAVRSFELIYFCNQGKGVNQEVERVVGRSGYVRVGDALPILITMVQNEGHERVHDYAHEYVVAEKFLQAHTLQESMRVMLKNRVSDQNLRV